jgi:hypothetical protein
MKPKYLVPQSFKMILIEVDLMVRDAAGRSATGRTSAANYSTSYARRQQFSMTRRRWTLPAGILRQASAIRPGMARSCGLPGHNSVSGNLQVIHASSAKNLAECILQPCSAPKIPLSQANTGGVQTEVRSGWVANT